VGTGGTTGRA